MSNDRILAQEYQMVSAGPLSLKDRCQTSGIRLDCDTQGVSLSEYENTLYV